jgi:Zn-dependent peptidase ImmA (M78 family)/transcriptional regulator with XRE-family HTH domain
MEITSGFSAEKHNLLLYKYNKFIDNYNISFYISLGGKNMSIQNKLSELLKKEREELGFTLKNVSQQMEFNNYQTLSSIEAGEREIKAWELGKLAKIYGRDIEYFLSFDSPQAETEILWRNPCESNDQELIRRKFLTICRNYHNLSEILDEADGTDALFKFVIDKRQLISEHAFKYVAKIASQYVDLLNLGCRPVYSLAKILEEKMGIKIVYLPIESDISGGATIDPNFGMAILINSNDAPWRRNYDLAHEFFHLLTWDIFTKEEVYQQKEERKSHVEQLADVFASSLLLPEEEVRNEFAAKSVDKSISYLNLIEIARDFSVSIDALMWRLVNLKLLKREKVQEELQKGLIKDVDKKQRKSDWTDTEKPYLSDQYISLAIRAFQLGKISKGKFAEYVDEKYSEISSFLLRYGYDENEDYSFAYRTA